MNSLTKKVFFTLCLIISSIGFSSDTSSLETKPITNTERLIISSLEELNSLLDRYPEIKREEWVKSPVTLFNEIQTNECFLEVDNGKLRRVVELIQVQCFYTNDIGEKFQLIEEKQVFKNGLIRKRGFKYVAEKMHEGESAEQAALRGLAEELNISGDDVFVTPKPSENSLKELDSPSYIGLSSIYKIYVFTHEVSKNNYKQLYIEEQKDKDTFFTWEKI